MAFEGLDKRDFKKFRKIKKILENQLNVYERSNKIALCFIVIN
jgi:hypothetical protein